MENNERPASGLPAGPDTRIQLVVDRPTQDEVSIDLGRVLHNMKLKSRVFAWVLVLCLVVGICAPLLLYQFTAPSLTLTSVVTLRYSRAAGGLVAPDGGTLDLNTVTSSPVLQKALEGLTLSQPVTIENIRNNMTVTRVLTEDSSRTREILAGLADAKNVEVYNRMEEAEMTYQNRFIVSLTNGFGDEESRVKYDLTDEELRILLNRILDAYNETLIRQYANFRLPEDKIALIDTEIQDIPEVLDDLRLALRSLRNYCNNQPAEARAYRSWQTGLSLDDWSKSIRTVQTVSADYLEAYVYANGLMRDGNNVRQTFDYQLRTLQFDYDEIDKNIKDVDKLLEEYKNDKVLVGLQEANTTRTTNITTDYYNNLVLQQLSNYTSLTGVSTEIAETQNRKDRLTTSSGEKNLEKAEAELASVLAAARNLQDGVRNHMLELFESPLYTTYTEHSVPQGKLDNFLVASMKKIIIGAVAGAIVACGLWFLAGLAPEFRRGREEEEARAKKAGKEAAEA